MVMTLASASATTLAATPGVLRRESLPMPLIDSPRLGVAGILVIFVYIEFVVFVIQFRLVVFGLQLHQFYFLNLFLLLLRLY
jgi:hypothetical protein